MQNASGAVVLDTTFGTVSGIGDTGALDVSNFKSLRVEVEVLTCSGGATNNVAMETVDAATGQATYGSGVPCAYLKTGTASPFMLVHIGEGVGGTLGNNGGNVAVIQARVEFLRVILSVADNANAFTARIRIVGFK